MDDISLLTEQDAALSVAEAGKQESHRGSDEEQPLGVAQCQAKF
jgi:hypothetical protein